MKIERVELAITLVENAIKNKITLKESCRLNNAYANFVKNVKYQYLELGLNETTIRFTELLNEYDNLKKDGKISFKSSINDNTDVPETKCISIQGNTPTQGNTNQITITGNNIAKDIEYKCNDSSRIKTLDQLLTEAKVDKKIWQVKDYTLNKWDTSTIRNNVAQVIENFQVKARLEKVQGLEDVYSVIDIFNNVTKNYKPKDFTYDVKLNEINKNVDNLFEVSIFDLHMGKLAWHGEVGEDYDTKIASSRFLTAIKTLIDRASGFGFNRILFPIGSDFFNSDNHNNTTTAGTPQDEDLRWQKTFTLGCELIVDGINLLKACGVPVDVIVIPGNHDFERSYYMGEFMRSWFRNDSLVNIDNSASPRKYYQFNKVLLGFTHGDAEKQDSLPMMMAGEQKELWGKTDIHEWHCGHLHRKKTFRYKTQSLNEDLGVTVRYLSSLTGTEEWHHKKGFVGALKAAEGFIWCGVTGLIGHLNTNIMVENTFKLK